MGLISWMRFQFREGVLSGERYDAPQMSSLRNNMIHVYRSMCHCFVHLPTTVHVTVNWLVLFGLGKKYFLHHQGNKRQLIVVFFLSGAQRRWASLILTHCSKKRYVCIC